MQPGATLIFLDANILYSRTLRDWFCLISKASGVDGIALRWSEDVMAEYQYHVRRKNPGWSEQQVGGWRRRLNDAFPDAMVTDYVIDPELLEGKDRFDAHAVSAAAHGRVDYLVTSNDKDFKEIKEQYEFETFTPDDMLSLIYERRADAVRIAAKDQVTYWARHEEGKPLPQALIDAGAPNFADHVGKLLANFALTGNY